MPMVAAIAALAVGVGGGIASAQAKKNGITEAGDAQKAAISAMIAKLDEVGMPPDQSAALILDQYRQAGLLTPDLERQIGDAHSEFTNIKRDEGTRNIQVNALKQMAQYGRAGLNEDERAQSRVAQGDVQRDLEAKQQQIMQNLAARGQGGGGAEIAQRLLASQAGADRASSEADRISSLASQRALQAISQQSNMANQLRSQDYGEDSAKAAAMDQMNRFNVENQIGINQRNTNTSNQAKQINLTNLQDVTNKNTTSTNAEKYAQLERQRQYWQDKLQYAQAYASPLSAYGNAAATQAKGLGDAQSEMWSKMGQMGSSSIGSMGMMGGGGAAGAK